jgi:flagellar hook-length control protein FliK
VLNTIAPIAPTPPVESRPSPKPTNPHAFATLLRQSQRQAPTPAKSPPAPSQRSDRAADADPTAATTRPAANAATTMADARRRDDAKSAADASDAGRADAHAKADDDASDHGDKDKADASATSGASGTGVPMTHGLVATHRPAVLMSEGAAAGADRGTTTNAGDAADPRGGASTSSTSATSDALVARGTADLARKDEPTSFARAAAAAGAADSNTTRAAATTSPLIEVAKAAPLAPAELRTEATLPSVVAPAPNAASATSAAPVDAAVAAPVASPEFAQAFAVQVSVLVEDGVQRAELHLNPAEMGPVSVHIVVDGTQARIDFGADALATRQAIEAGLPELASALRDAGMTLQGGGVSQHARDPHEGAKPGDGSAASSGPWRDDEPRPGTVARSRTVAAGGVDLYA